MEIYDQLNRKIFWESVPQRIISLVPSITYTLSDFGLDNQVVGITRFCKFLPYSKKSKTIIGGTKDIKIERVKSLLPDIIIANKEENTKEIVEELEQIAPVFVSNIQNIEHNYNFINSLGKIFNREKIAQKYIKDIDFYYHKLIAEQNKRKKTIYLIWKKPWMTIGGDTYINKMMEISGFENLYQSKKRYPETSIEEMKSLNPEIIFLSSEPYPFKKVHKNELRIHFPQSKIILVEGEAFTWFGTYALKGLKYLLNLKNEINAY